MFNKKSILTLLAAAVILSAVPTSAEAGPLLDWLRARRNCRQQCQTCNTSNCNTCATPSYVNTSFQQPTLGAHNPAGLQPGQCMRTCNQTCSRTVVNYVPCTSYRTAWNRVPVTQYKPVTNTDPCTGCTVTCMKPCTTYSWQMKREPYTTYRPVYRTENYSVPVTTITNDCATGNCGPCNTCPTSNCATCPTTAQAPQVVYPNPSMGTNTNLSGSYYTYPQNGSVAVPNGSLNTNGAFSTPADLSPTLEATPQNRQKPIIEKLNDNDSSANWPRVQAPLQTQRRTFNDNIRPISDPNAKSNWMNASPNFTQAPNKTANSTVTKRWSYSPVRLASYTSTPASETRTNEPTRVQGTYVPKPASSPSAAKSKAARSGWKTIEW